MKYSIGNLIIDFNIERVKKNYSEKEKFFSDYLSIYKEIDEKELKKVLDRAWKEAFPKTDKIQETI
jgi:hypothetical protein